MKNNIFQNSKSKKSTEGSLKHLIVLLLMCVSTISLPYIKNQKSSMKSIPPTRILDLDYAQVFEGVNNLDYQGNFFSSVQCPETSYRNLFSAYNIGTMGTYGKGRVLTFGHPRLFSIDLADNSIFVQNAMAWLCKGKIPCNLGCLF